MSDPNEHLLSSSRWHNSMIEAGSGRWMGHGDTRMVHRHYGHLLSYDDDINAIGRPKENE